MIELKIGDTVLVDGKTSYIETHWCQLNDKVFKLTDGRLVHNLDKLVAEGKAQWLNETGTISRKEREDKWYKREKFEK